MAKAVFGEYAAFTTQGGIRFMKNSKLISKNALPPEVVAYLSSEIEKNVDVPEVLVPDVVKPKFARPSEEELARMREESVKVKPELQLTPEEQAARDLTGVPDNEEPLQPDDFEEPTPAERRAELPQVIESAIDLGQAIEQTKVDPSFLESVSIHTAPVEALAQAFYDRFGVYSIFLGTLPASDEINPLTGERFSKYHLGIAYQAAISVQAKGGIRNPEQARQAIDQGRQAHESVKDSFDPVPQTLGDARRANSFEYRTSTRGNQTVPTTKIVHETDPNTGQVRAVQVEIPAEEQGAGSNANSRYDADEDQQLIEPPIFGTKSIIRPNW